MISCAAYCPGNGVNAAVVETLYFRERRRRPMLFQSLSFIWLFLPVSLLIYYLAPPKARNGLLFFLSLVFYGLGEFWYLPAALLSVTCDYFLGRRIQQFWRQPKASKPWFWIS